MNRETFRLFAGGGLDKFTAVGEIWVSDSSNAIACIDYLDHPSRTYFTHNHGELVDSIRSKFRVNAQLHVFEEWDFGQYIPVNEDYVRESSYAEVAEEGYGLIGLSERVFPQSEEQEQDEQAQPLILACPVVFEIGLAECATHVWSNGKGQGVVLLDFEPDRSMVDSLIHRGLENVVAERFELHSGLLLYLPYEDDDYGLRRSYAPSDRYLTESPGALTYSEVKLIGHQFVEQGIGMPQEQPLAFHITDLSIEPGF